MFLSWLFTFLGWHPVGTGTFIDPSCCLREQSFFAMSLAFSSFPLSFSTATVMTRSSVSMGLSAQSGSDFAKTLPGVTGPLDFFVRSPPQPSRTLSL